MRVLVVSVVITLFFLVLTSVQLCIQADNVELAQLNSTWVSGYHWVLALPGESHAKACRVHQLNPTAPQDDIPWGEDIMNDVVTGLGLQVVDKPNGLLGCCVPGLWCVTDGGPCFTQSLQTNFVNIELSPKYNLSSVYTCVDYNLENMVTGFLSYEDKKVTLKGENYGMERDSISATINSEDCADVDLCHTVCQPCTTYSCPTGSVCLSMSSYRGCFMYCAGEDDTSCPCSTSCRQVNVRITQASYLSTHLCAPDQLSCTNYFPSSGSHLQCHSPSVYSQIYEEYEWSNAEQEISLSVENDATVFSNVLQPLQCTADSDCFDMNAYTTDSCNEMGICNYTKKEYILSETLSNSNLNVTVAVGTTPGHIRDRTTPYTYTWFHLADQGLSQSLFESTIHEFGMQSSVSDVDDYPVEFFDLDFSINYFGNTWNEVSINPNGILAFPPYSHCWGMISGLGCPVHRTSTNVISLWGRDWDPSRDHGGAPATVMTYQQEKTESDFNMFGINSSAFHVMYSNVHKYSSGPSVPGNANSFSVSIYEDGSTRLRYHNKTIDIENSDSFGLWGSRAATSSSPLLSYESSSTRYHEETFNATSIVRNEQDVVFCSLSTLACVPNSCAQEGQNLTFNLLGNEPSCIAGAGDIFVRCIWAGIVETSPSFYSLEGSNGTLVHCPIPFLDIADNSLISLDLQFLMHEAVAKSPSNSGQKSIYTKYLDPSTGEIVNDHTMVRYFHSDSTTNDVDCGCDAKSPHSTSSLCNSCLVCGDSETENLRDCNGECLGTAYIDTCGACTGGSTGRHPISSCDYKDDKMDDGIDTISKTILFLTMMICMTFMFTACLRIARSSIRMEENREGVAFQQQQRPVPLRRGNGLSNFEIDSLGEDTFKLIRCDLEIGSGVYGPRESEANMECAICLTDFLDSSMCRQLPCEHVFHKSCIDEWFILSVKCPMCKRNIRDIILGEEAVPQRRAPSFTPDGTEASISTEPSDEGSDSGVENPLIVEMVPRNS